MPSTAKKQCKFETKQAAQLYGLIDRWGMPSKKTMSRYAESCGGQRLQLKSEMSQVKLPHLLVTVTLILRSLLPCLQFAGNQWQWKSVRYSLLFTDVRVTHTATRALVE